MSIPCDTPPGRSELRAEIERLRAELAALHETCDQFDTTATRLRAELTESERKHVLRLEAHIRTDCARAEAEAALARVRELCGPPRNPAYAAVLRALDAG